jgi:hypothetical protein
MRKREDIKRLIDDKANYAEVSLEVLLDIRDLLVELSKTLKK